ncbi:MAG: hypothetical protein ICV73_26660, partial [Acetobacteraceae bacterium]|nr:hypothetical protein [Acetobacteraceae bacterium]
MAARTTTADNCRVHDAIESALYRPPPWTAAYALRVWKLAFHRLEHDPALLSLPRDARRRMGRALWALFKLRRRGTGYCDAHLEALCAAADYRPSSLKVGLRDLWRHRVIRRIPRKVYDPDHWPRGWKTWGAYRQATNAYEPREPDAPSGLGGP